MDQLDRERPRLDLLAGVHILELGVAQPVLVELGTRHRDRQRTAIHDRRIGAELTEHPRERAEVILVPVGDDDRLDVLRPDRAGS